MSEADAALRDRAARILRAEVAPALEMDGTAIEVLDAADGVLRIRLHGACGSCPGSVYAVVMGIEEELRKRIPEVRYLEVAP
ncbi:MAG TPA: NifU family protein [Gemmataceae bacterium]|nr:NifU family protein [Gemmataceae bacterium]